jgi:HAD superfamily phosphoserine phosphatase-like hydrolase
MPGYPDWLHPFSPGFRKAIVRLPVEGTGRRIACFDADGTLWSYDIGEAFFRWLIAGRLLKGVDYGRDLYAEYEEWTRRDRTAAYASVVAMMKGLPEPDVATWAGQMAAAWPCYRPAMAGLMRGLAGAGFEVWIVSASNHWVVTAAVARLGVEPSRVLAIRSEVRDGVLTGRVIEPVTCEAGKVEAMGRHIGRMPDLACGDSMGDFEMLRAARLGLVVGTREAMSRRISDAAAEHGWPVHFFR